MNPIDGVIRTHHTANPGIHSHREGLEVKFPQSTPINVRADFVTLYLLSAGVSVLMSGITVYMRDMAHLIEVLLQLTFWLTPVVYSYENTISPALARHGVSWLYFVNPMTPIVMTFQRIFYGATNAISTNTGQVLHVLPQWSLTHFWVVNLILLGIVGAFYLLVEYLFGRLEVNFESEL